MRRKALGGFLAGVAILVASAGCGGGSSPPPPGSPAVAEYLIEASDIEKVPEGSPQESLLRWWRSIQYNDVNGYLAALSAPLRSQRERDHRLREEVSLVAGELNKAQPKVVNVQFNGDKATVFTRVEVRQPVGGTRYTATSYPQAFSLVKEGGQWKIADDYFVKQHAANIAKAVRQAEEEKK